MAMKHGKLEKICSKEKELGGGEDENMNMKLRKAVMRNETMFCSLCSAEIPREYIIHQTLRS